MSKLKNARLVLVTVLVFAVFLEIAVRKILLPKGFRYIEVTSDQFPFFRVIDSYKDGAITIRDHRREGLPRGDRKRRIAFVGDSVTFCANTYDSGCFVEMIQEKQGEFDVYNFGVPGYGLSEIDVVVRDILKKGHYDYIFYLFNINDVHSAMPVQLALLEDGRHRITSLNYYSGWRGRLKQVLKDSYKTPFYLNYARSVYLGQSPTKGGQMDLRSPSSLKSASFVPTTGGCEEGYFEKLRNDPFTQNVFPVWKKIYSDENVREHVRETLLSLRKEGSLRGSEFLVAPFYDFSIMDDPSESVLASFSNNFQTAFSLNSLPLFKGHYRECRFYADPGHLARVGNEYLARFFLDFLSGRSTH